MATDSSTPAEEIVSQFDLPQEIAEFPFRDAPGGNVVQSLLDQFLKHPKFFGLLDAIGNSRFTHIFREKIECGRSPFGGPVHVTF